MSVGANKVEYILDAHRDEARVLVIPQNGVRLPTTRLAVREDSGIVSIHSVEYKRLPNFCITLVVLRLRTEAMIEAVDLLAGSRLLEEGGIGILETHRLVLVQFALIQGTDADRDLDGRAILVNDVHICGIEWSGGEGGI